MSHPVPATLATLALATGCGGGETVAVSSLSATKEMDCEVGGRPHYFVPGPDADEPLAIIGCARLGASGRPVEFSSSAESIGSDPHLCINPAYRGRGQVGIYIPAVCPSNPPPNRLEVHDVGVPRQAVRGYGLVIWGTAPPAARGVVVRQDGAQTTGAVFQAGPRLARAAGAREPFAVFVVELPSNASCAPIIVSANGPPAPHVKRIIRNRCRTR